MKEGKDTALRLIMNPKTKKLEAVPEQEVRDTDAVIPIAGVKN
jgi:hypothetical protein